MRRVPFPQLLLLLTTFVVATGRLSAAPAPSFTITGVVVDSVTSNPITRAHLDASLVVRGRAPGRRPQSASGADADEHGRFTVVLPSAGAWHLTASAPGYVTQAYDEHGDYSSAVVLTQASPSLNLRFSLPPQARISGTVVDDAAEAVRNATVQLVRLPLSSPEHRQAEQISSRWFVQTDDRGAYEFANLAPGNYRLSVQAKPWYANSARQRRFMGGALSASQPSMPVQSAALDVAYQLTWYPGMDDPAQAETLALVAGDDRRADFHLTPIPALHLQIPPPAPAQQTDGRRIPSFPIVERIDTGGGNAGFVQPSTTTGPQGQIDVGGLSPGTYRIRLQGQNQDSRTAVVTLSEGSSRSIDFNAAAEAMSTVTVRFEMDTEDGRSPLVELTDTATGQRFFPVAAGRPMPPNMRRGPQAQALRDISLQVPPGRYEVSLQNSGDAYLTGVSAQGADVSGRFLTIHGGDVALLLHTASGHAAVTGVAASKGAPCVGAVILLVPAGLDDPGSFTAVVRDQSNTDGSFDLEGVVPGQYILIALDRGWGVNLSDPSTLRSYLTQGVPLDLRSGANMKQNIEAQLP
ncbi:MAG: carboxypeptidase regulatory-like domain-containing protein [Acidobacteria bacterium]|nr:carboxypeptidase regulatory-like domain-containing protein [Acidobacteriota bacterium]